MYLTAQRVVSSDGQQGINAFFHLHRPHKQPKPTTPSEVVAVAENNTGKLIKDTLEVNPGGNRVKSYLDIVAPDTTDAKAIITALDKFRGEIDPARMGPIFSFNGGIGLRFNTEIEMHKVLNDEYDTLKDRVVVLFRYAHK
ncbi:MAG: hypothetical protein V1913_01500 [Fibrobacterota bacterium]